MRGSRSSLRRIGVPYGGRKRWYLLRALCAVLIIAAICGFLWGVQTQYFNKSGIGAVIYTFHDTLYLWAKGQAWVQYFPYALIWLVPLAIAFTLIGIEFVTPMDPIRALHRRLILTVVEYRWAQGFLARPLGQRQIVSDEWVASLTPTANMKPRWFGFARRVVHRAQENLWLHAALDLAEGFDIAPRNAKRLAMLSGMRLRFDPSDGGGHLSALEVIAATSGLHETQKLAQHMADFYATQEDSKLVKPLSAALDTLRKLNPEDMTFAAGELTRVNAMLQSITSEDITPNLSLHLSCCALEANVIGWRCRLPEVTQFQRQWVRLRLIADSPEIGEAIETAEGLIFFELWSKLAEVAPRPPEERSLLALAIGTKEGDIPGLIDAPEHYAWTGATR